MNRHNDGGVNPEKTSSWLQLLVLVGGVAISAIASAWVYGSKVGQVIEQNAARDQKIAELQQMVWPDHDLIIRIDANTQKIDKSVERVENLIIGTNRAQPWAPYWEHR